MPGPLLTLLTDFGPASVYVAQLKGRLLSDMPDARLVDLSHVIPPQDVRRASLMLDECIDWYPPETIHLAIVDPGVGTSRRLCYARAAQQHFLAPDNGLLDRALRRHSPEFVRALRPEACARGPVSATFHGRDLLAPTAVLIANGVPADRFSDRVNVWVELPDVEPVLAGNRILGQVMWIDRFGNLISNIDARLLERIPIGRKLAVECHSRRVDRLSTTYGDERPGTLLALIGSSGKLEVAIAQGNAANVLGVRVDDDIFVEWQDRST